MANTPCLNIKVKTGPATSTACVLNNEQKITFGRGPENDCVLSNDPGISRQHFEIYFADDKCWIKDLKSRNGTYVNSHSILSGQLKTGDEIRVGNTILEVEAKTEPNFTDELTSKHIGTHANLMVSDDTTVLTHRQLHSYKIARDKIFTEKFLQLFHDLPGQAVLSYCNGFVDSMADEHKSKINDSLTLCFPPDLETLKGLLPSNQDGNSFILMNFTSSRSQLSQHIRERTGAFSAPAEFLENYKELPVELSAAILNGIDLAICDETDSDEATAIFERRHSVWLKELFPASEQSSVDSTNR